MWCAPTRLWGRRWALTQPPSQSLSLAATRVRGRSGCSGRSRCRQQRGKPARGNAAPDAPAPPPAPERLRRRHDPACAVRGHAAAVAARGAGAGAHGTYPGRRHRGGQGARGQAGRPAGCGRRPGCIAGADAGASSGCLRCRWAEPSTPCPAPVLPVQAKTGAGSATLSMAAAAARFVDACLRAMAGEPGVVECAYVASTLVTGLPFFASQLRLGSEGIQGEAGCRVAAARRRVVP